MHLSDAFGREGKHAGVESLGGVRASQIVPTRRTLHSDDFDAFWPVLLAAGRSWNGFMAGGGTGVLSKSQSARIESVPLIGAMELQVAATHPKLLYETVDHRLQLLHRDVRARGITVRTARTRVLLYERGGSNFSRRSGRLWARQRESVSG
jgi:hypothetical protein